MPCLEHHHLQWRGTAASQQRAAWPLPWARGPAGHRRKNGILSLRGEAAAPWQQQQRGHQVLNPHNAALFSAAEGEAAHPSTTALPQHRGPRGTQRCEGTGAAEDSTALPWPCLPPPSPRPAQHGPDMATHPVTLPATCPAHQPGPRSTPPRPSLDSYLHQGVSRRAGIRWGRLRAVSYPLRAGRGSPQCY